MRAGWMGDDFKPERVLPTLTEKVETLIDAYAQDEEPFFIYLPLPAPHTPILPAAEFQGQTAPTSTATFFCRWILRLATS